MIAGNQTFQIYNPDGSSFNGLELKKSVYESIVMSLGDKITGDVYYPNNALVVTMKEYILYNGVKFVLVNPPTIVREGMVSDNGELKGMTKYSFTFYHPMYMLGNFPLCDVAVSQDQQRYLSENKTFAWIGSLNDFVAKLNKNLENTEWYCVINDSVSQADRQRLSDVMSFDKNSIADALKTGYETWDVPYIISVIPSSNPLYQQGKRFLIQYGLPSTEILVENAQHELVPFVFHFGQGVGLKNNSRTPRNNKIVTRIAGYGSENNIQYGYPQIPYEGGDCQYPLYYGIVGGQRVQLIKHPFTRTHLMPSIYRETVNKKVNPMATGYDPTIEIKDYYDADNTYENPIKPLEPSYEIHEFENIKPEFGQRTIVGVSAYSDKDLDSINLSSFLSLLSEYYTESEYEKEKEEIEKIANTIGTYSSNSGSVNTRAYYCDWAFTKDERYAYVKFASSALNFEYTVLMVSPSQDVAWDDTMDDDGNYAQSYFKITIPQLAFDIYASAAVTQEMTINMRSGACLGCSFPVMVDWDDYKLNFYDSDGNFTPDGSQRNYEKYPDSRQGQITLILKKETSTFGTLMPNVYQKPHAGDEFVVLGISLPTTYITDAEARLDAEMKQYMRDNNVYYFDYPLKFDEHFLTTHEGILAQMDNNVIVRFDYAGTEHALYIKQISVKYDNKPLPTYDITLTDNIEVVLNQIGQAIDEVRRLHDNLGGVGYQMSNNYLRKDIDDTAYGTIRLIKGLQVGNRFVTGLLGEGGVFRKEDDGTTYLECDKMYVRMKAYFDTVEVKHYLHSAGNRVASNAGINCSRVEYIDANGNVTQDATEATLYRCYFRANDDGREIRNDFVVGDLAFCKETNVNTDSVDQHGYWRAVVGRNANGVLTEDGEGWIDLSASDCQTGSGIPIAQDDIVQLGNKTDTTRQGAIVEFVSGADAPSYQIYQGINTYSLNGKNYIGFGYSSQTGHAYMNVYGDTYIGTTPDVQESQQTYIRYNSQTKKLDIKASIDIQSPVVDGQTTKTLQEIFDGLQDQIDGNIDTWFYNGAPYPSEDNTDTPNLPYTQWTTDTDKINHEGDLYYDRATGYAYRFGFNTDTQEYEWFKIHDQDITEALRLAAEAKDAADDAEEHAASFDYIKVALENKTQVFGGLMLTSLIGLGQRDQSDNFTMWSGINGIYNDLKYGGGVAAWYGGAMGDVEHQDQYPNVTRHPKTLFRMDGSGYVANGSISWDATGLTNVNVSSISAATINLGGKGVATQEWVGLNYISIAYFDRLFRAYNGNTLVNHNDITSTIDNIKAMFGFWTDFYLSALGNNSQITNGITLDLLSDVTINNPSIGQVLTYNGSKWVNQAISVGVTELSSLADVTLTTPIADKQVLTYDVVSGKWVNGNGGASSIANLTDVQLSQVQTNQALIYDGTAWVNTTLKTVNGYSIIGTGDIPASGGGTGNYVAKAGDTMSGTLNIHEPNVSALNLKRTALGAVLMRFFADNQSTNGWAVGVSGGNSFVVTHSENGFSTDSISMEMLTNGNIGIGTRNPSTKVHVVGDVTATRYRLASGYIENGSLNEVDLYNYMEFRVRTIYGGREYGYSFANFYFGPFSAAVGTVDLGRVDGRWKTVFANHLDLVASTTVPFIMKRSTVGGTFMDLYANNQASNIWRFGAGDAYSLLFAYTSDGWSNSFVAFEVLPNGNIGIGTRSPSYKLHVAGTIYATGAITALSDARKKDITGEADVSVEQIAHAPAVQFLWKDKERRKDGNQVGTLAQYWKTVLPEVVSDKGGELSMQYGVTALVSAIITARKVVDHERRITELEKENERLRTKIEQLRLN